MKFVKENTIKKTNIEHYNQIVQYNNNFHNPTWIQMLYNYNNKITDPPKCLNCNNNVKFYRFSIGYRKFCSNLCNLKSKSTKEKRNYTKIKKFGDINYNNREKYKGTNLLKYGDTSPMKNKYILEKRNKTNILKYGDITPLKNNDVINKIKKTNLIKYGVENPMQCAEIKKKCENTLMSKYGVKHPICVAEIKEKIKNTNQKKYGTNNPFQNKEIIQKIKDTNNITFKEKWSKILNTSLDKIFVDGDIITIIGLCDKHEIFKITKSLLRDRYKYNVPYCPECNVIGAHDSDLENEVRNFIGNELNIKIEKIRIDNKEIDIYLPSHKLGIEFDGLYWHSELYKDKNYHLNKTEICEKHGIQLLHIFEDEWIRKKEIIKSIIRTKLGFINNKIFARKCFIKEIDNETCKEFLKINHIQGNVNAKIRIGLFLNDNLVSVMCFEKTRKSIDISNNSFTLNRFASKINTLVIGGAGKLLNYFIRTYNPKVIVSFADRRYSQGKLYDKLGFIKIKYNLPSYSYFKNNEFIRYHRFNFRKEILQKRGFDINKTERDIMFENNYLKIYDCGNIKYLMKF